MSWIQSFVFSVIFAFSSLVYAGGYVVGNTGNVILRDNRAYLVDLVENGFKESSYLWLRSDDRIQNYAKTIFNQPDFSKALPYLTHKLSTLNQQMPALGDMLLVVMSSYQWQFVNEPLVRRSLDGILSIENAEVYQVANRYANSVRIQKSLWQKMPIEHQVALIFHETISAILIKNSQTNAQHDQIAQLVRIQNVTGGLFRSSAEAYSKTDLINLFDDDFYLPLKFAVGFDDSNAVYGISPQIPSLLNNLKPKLVVQRGSKVLNLELGMLSDKELQQKLGELCSYPGKETIELLKVKPAWVVEWIDHNDYDRQVSVRAIDPASLRTEYQSRVSLDIPGCIGLVRSYYKSLAHYF